MDAPRRSAGREAMWAAMREAKEFSVQTIVKEIGAQTQAVRDYVTALRRAGIVAIVGKTEGLSGNPGAFPRSVYRVIQDTGVDAPRVRKDGSLLPETGRDRLWRVMRILKDFTVLDLAVQASLPEAPVTEGEATYYCLCLTRAGYLVGIEPGRRYRFLQSKYTGPLAPVVRRVREVVDANTGEVRFRGDAREERP